VFLDVKLHLGGLQQVVKGAKGLLLLTQVFHFYADKENNASDANMLHPSNIYTLSSQITTFAIAAKKLA